MSHPAEYCSASLKHFVIIGQVIWVCNVCNTTAGVQTSAILQAPYRKRGVEGGEVAFRTANYIWLHVVYCCGSHYRATVLRCRYNETALARGSAPPPDMPPGISPVVASLFGNHSKSFVFRGFELHSSRIDPSMLWTKRWDACQVCVAAHPHAHNSQARKRHFFNAQQKVVTGFHKNALHEC